MIDAHATPQYSRAANLAWRRVLDELVVLDLQRRMVYGLGEEAAALFERLGEPRALLALVAGEAGDGDGDDSRRAAVTGLLAELAAAGIVVCDAPLPVAHVNGGGSAIRWREQLEQVTHQVSPPQQIGNPQCIQ